MKNYEPTLLLDACVVSDVLNIDVEIVSLVSRFLGAVCVPDVIVDELCRKFELDDIESLGFEILKVSDAIKYEAALLVKQEGCVSLSTNDCSCLLLASQLNYVCVTNDKSLQNACRKRKVSTLWELEVILQLYERGGISYERAESYLIKLKQNSTYITDSVATRFKNQIERLRKNKAR